MFLKCMIVGLALVLPGTLLPTEGRYSGESGDAGTQDNKQFLRSLVSFLNQDRQPENTKREETAFDAFAQDSIQLQAKEQSPQAQQQAQQPQTPPEPQTQPQNGDKPSPSEGGGRGAGENALAGGGGAAAPQALPLQHNPQAKKDKGAGGGLLASNAAFIMIVAGCTVLAGVGIIGAGVAWYKYNSRAKAASTVDYPAYGVTGPTKDRLPSPGDRKLAQSAQMYHYQHQKQQMIAMEKANGDMKHDASDESEEEDNVEGDYTVYECPGLAPTGEMEVKNPLFRGDETPSTPVREDSQDPPAGP